MFGGHGKDKSKWMVVWTSTAFWVGDLSKLDSGGRGEGTSSERSLIGEKWSKVALCSGLPLFLFFCFDSAYLHSCALSFLLYLIQRSLLFAWQISTYTGNLVYYTLEKFGLIFKICQSRAR